MPRDGRYPENAGAIFREWLAFALIGFSSCGKLCKMNIQINVYASPWNQQSCQDALAFGQSAVASGHKLQRVFFFMDGVYNGLRSQAPATDETDILAQWLSLKQRSHCELLLCVAASANRGLLSAEEAARQSKDTATVAEGFELAGLGQWALGYGECDKVVSFR